MSKHGFVRRRGSVGLTLEEGERDLLNTLLGQLLELLEPEGSDAHEQLDPLAAMVGIGTATAVPDDPVLARLLPDAYGDDPEAASEFRRYTELSLRADKQARARSARASLAAPNGSVLSSDELDAWLRTLNDLRLALGTRLGVSEDLEAEAAALEALPEGDPLLLLHDIYGWLGYLQMTLLRTYER